MFSHFAKTCQRVSLDSLLKIGRPKTYNRVRATAKVGDWDADKYSKDATFVFKDSAPLLDLLNPRPGERILDLGCGSGELTMVLKDSGSEVVGVDVSPAMVEASKAKGLDARVCDGRDLNFKEEFDAVFSNMALQWMKKDPRKVVKNIYNALKKNGRFAAEFAVHGSTDSFLKHAMPILMHHGALDASPFYAPSEEEYRHLLESEGFHVKYISLLPRDTPVPGGIRTILDIYVARFVAGLEDDKKEQVFKEIEEAIGDSRIDDKGNYMLDILMMTVAAMKPN